MLLSVTSQEISEQIVICKHFSITFMNNYTQETIHTIQIPKQSNPKTKATRCKEQSNPMQRTKQSNAEPSLVLHPQIREIYVLTPIYNR